MKISELIAAVGDENVTIQPLDSCADSLNYSKGKGTKITFGTDEPLEPHGTVRMGIVVWLPRDAVKEAIAKWKAESGKPKIDAALDAQDGRLGIKVVVDPAVPKGCVDIRNPDGTLAARLR